MTRSTIDQLVYLLDEAFEGREQPYHSILGNLASVTEDDWLWVPPSGARTIRRITGHVGGAVYLYYDRAFGGCSEFGDPVTNWNIPIPSLGHGTGDLDDSPHLDPEPPMADVIAWVSGRAAAFRDAVAALDSDDALSEERVNHRGQPQPVRWFIATMINHFAYHAGEINHIRALHQKNDG